MNELLRVKKIFDFIPRYLTLIVIHMVANFNTSFVDKKLSDVFDFGFIEKLVKSSFQNVYSPTCIKQVDFNVFVCFEN